MILRDDSQRTWLVLLSECDGTALRVWPFTGCYAITLPLKLFLFVNLGALYGGLPSEDAEVTIGSQSAPQIYLPLYRRTEVRP